MWRDPPYRCINCHWQSKAIPPERCPACFTNQFERYKPVCFGRLQLLIFATISFVYLLATRLTVEVYDPIWLVSMGCREGYPSVSLVGLFVATFLVPGMFVWLIVHRAFAYVISAISWIIWFAFCFWMREIVFA